MPPRRSCFIHADKFARRYHLVSMPPRRSCFGLRIEGVLPGGESFNATTAFLLRAYANTDTKSRLLWFQCHHGVPASAPGLGEVICATGRFNATTAFLLRVGASGIRPGGSCFNATTAFLLPAGGRYVGDHVAVVSMPPRRSCFLTSSPMAARWIRVSMPPRRSCFFQRPWPGTPVSTRVSMPPRRSCFRAVAAFCQAWKRFQCHHGVPASSCFGLGS